MDLVSSIDAIVSSVGDFFRASAGSRGLLLYGFDPLLHPVPLLCGHPGAANFKKHDHSRRRPFFCFSPSDLFTAVEFFCLTNVLSFNGASFLP